MKRILFVVNHAGYFVSHRLPLARAANEEGYEVHVATPRSKHVPLIEAAGLPWHPVALTRSGLNPFAEASAVRDLIRLYREVKPDLVHQVTAKPVLYGTIAARITRVPAVVNALAGLGHVHLSDDLFNRSLSAALKLGYRFALNHPHMKVIFQNEDDREVFVRRGILRREETVIVPGSGVDTELFSPRASRPAGPPVVMLPSRMLSTKGVREFVSAARSIRSDMPAVRFVLVGEPDPDNPASLTDAELAQWHREGVVEYWGRRDDMPEVLRQADIVCLPSYREGMPKVLIEAAACGVPVVTTDVPGCRDVVLGGETGLLVPVQDGGIELAKAIRKLLGDDDLRRTLAEKGRRRAVKDLSMQRIVRQILGVYEEMIG